MKQLREIRRLIPNRRFSEALDQLASIDRSRLSKSELGEFYILRAKASLFEGDHSCVEHDVVGAIEIFRHGAHTDLYAAAKYLMGRWLSMHGRHREAHEVLLEAYANYLRCNKRAECAEALNRLSYVSFQIGNMHSAIDNLRKCVAIYVENGERKNRYATAQNLYYLYFMIGRLRESVSGYSDIEPQITDLDARSLLIF